MHIITLILDGRGHIRITATRAPDLYRRQVAQETGEAHLIWCGVAPPQVSPRDFVDCLVRLLGHARSEKGYKVSPRAAVNCVRLLTLAVRAADLIRRLRRRFRSWANNLSGAGQLLVRTTSLAMLRPAVRE